MSYASYRERITLGALAHKRQHLERTFETSAGDAQRASLKRRTA